MNAWAQTDQGLLALLILTDQFRRNLYRGSGESFAMDDFARGLCRQALRRGAERRLRPIHRVMLYLPLEHSESLSDQDDSVRCFQRLATEVPTEQHEVFEGYLDYARSHREVIAEFGRFPHRNTALGRPSTPAERIYLEQPGAGF
mgnify:CR=1 FL=1